MLRIAALDSSSFMDDRIDIPYAGDEDSSDDDSIYFDAASTASGLALDLDVARIVNLTGDMPVASHNIPIDTQQQDGSPALLRPRAYQLEMLDEGLQRNIIIAVW